LSGAVVDLKPTPRAQPRPEYEPWMMCWGAGGDKEVRGIAGWNEVGPSWTIEGQEFVSARPKDRKLVWTSVFWPNALISSCAELSFEAKIEAGQITLLAPSPKLWGQGGNHAANHTCVGISSDAVRIREMAIFDHAPGFRVEGPVSAEGKLSGKPGQWTKYKVLCTKGAIAVFVDGKQVVELKRANTGLPMAFWVSPGEEYRLKNVSIRKAE
jgi:hypothetical protein